MLFFQTKIMISWWIGTTLLRRTKLISLAFHFKQVIAFDWLHLIIFKNLF
jgi:hypothetical protein